MVTTVTTNFKDTSTKLPELNKRTAVMIILKVQIQIAILYYLQITSAINSCVISNIISLSFIKTY